MPWVSENSPDETTSASESEYFLSEPMITPRNMNSSMNAGMIATVRKYISGDGGCVAEVKSPPRFFRPKC